MIACPPANLGNEIAVLDKFCVVTTKLKGSRIGGVTYGCKMALVGQEFTIQLFNSLFEFVYERIALHLRVDSNDNSAWLRQTLKGSRIGGVTYGCKMVLSS